MIDVLVYIYMRGDYMNKVLVYDNRKIDMIAWDISSKEKEELAFLRLFRFLDRNWRCYTDIKEAENELRLIDDALIQLSHIESKDNHWISGDIERKIKNLEESRQWYQKAWRLKDLLEKARAGDGKAAMELLYARKDAHYEYEFFQIVTISR